MQRRTHAARPGWKDKVEQELGFYFHSPDGQPYWDETAHWELSEAEVDALETAAVEIHDMCLRACHFAVERSLFTPLGIPPDFAEAVAWSWYRFAESKGEEMPIYGRLDLAWNVFGEPKLLEYNASTPTSLYEASVVQWDWLQEFAPDADQFNGLHEALVERWRLRALTLGGKPVHFAAMDTAEDMGTASYMQSVAMEAGIATKLLAIDKIAYDAADKRFYDGEGEPIQALFSLYPPEWLLQDEWAKPLADAIMGDRLVLIEPLWKLLLTKGILSVLWDIYPHHPNLLKSSLSPTAFAAGLRVVAKPLWGREGDGVEIATAGPDGRPTGDVVRARSDRFAGQEGWIYQEYTPLLQAPGGHAVLGVWLVGNKAKGLGIREASGLITGDDARFVPHMFQPKG